MSNMSNMSNETEGTAEKTRFFNEIRPNFKGFGQKITLFSL